MTGQPDKKKGYKKPDKAAKLKVKQEQIEKNKLTRDQDTGEILIPPQVSNKEKYIEYIKLHDKVVEDPDHYYQTSDPELIVNTIANTSRIQESIKHLPEQEQIKIMSISTRIRKLSAKAAFLKKEAYGTVRQGGGSALQVDLNRDHKLFFGERGSEVIEYFGRYFTIGEVHRIIQQEWGYRIAINTLKQYRVDNIEKIVERQEEFKRDFSDIALGYKRSRLEQLSYLFQTRREIYSNTKKLDDSKELRAIIEQVRKEVEGDTLTINGAININHELRVQEQINNQLMKGLNLKAFIIASVAAKLGLDPVVLQFKLINSYYAKFTGFKAADNNILYDEIIYPSQLVYDFDLIKSKNTALIAEEAELVQELTPVITPAQKDVTDDFKTQVMKKLLENKSMNRKTKTIIESKKLKGGE